MLLNIFIYFIHSYIKISILLSKNYYYDEDNDYYNQEENKYKDIAEYEDIYDDQWGDEIYDYDNYDDYDDYENCDDNYDHGDI